MNKFNELFEESMGRYSEGMFSTMGGWIDKGIEKVWGGVKTAAGHVGSVAANVAKDVHKAGMEATGLNLKSDYKKPDEFTETVLKSAQHNKVLLITVGGVVHTLKYDGVHLIVTDANNKQADQQTVQKIVEYIKKTDFSGFEFSPEFNKTINQAINTYNQKNANV